VQGLMELLRRVVRAVKEHFGVYDDTPEKPNPLAWLGKKGHERHQAGWRAEEYAANHLVRRGYHILGRNVLVGGGEIDIIAEHDNRLIFIEVRSRSRNAPVPPASTVTMVKTRKILRYASIYMRERRLKVAQVRPRYDIAEVWLDERNRPCEFSLMEAAVSDRPRRWR